MIWATGIFILTLMIKLAFDIHLWINMKPNQHFLGAMVVLIMLILCSWLAGWISVPMWFFGYWALFDTLYALLIGQKWYYTGGTSFLDRAQSDFKPLKWAKYIIGISSPIFYLCLN